MTSKVLITTSGIGSRLGEFTRYTNKCLVRLGDKPIISHIVEMYPAETSFVITLGHYGNHVKEFLCLAYPDRKFEFISVNNFEGPGSSLGNSLLHARSILQEPFIFHASDTVLLGNSSLPRLDSNWVVGAPGNESAEYTSFDISGELISKFHSKGMIGFDYIHIGIAGIFDFEFFWEILAVLNQKNPSNGSISDVDALEAMKNNGFEIRHHRVDNWFDTGNVRSLQQARKACAQQFDVLEKGNESVFFIEKSVVKFFGDEGVNSKRVERSKILRGLVPEVEGYTQHFYKYPYQPGVELSKIASEREVFDLLKWAEVALWIKPEKFQRDEFYENCLNFYKHKTYARTKSFLERNELDDTESKINNLQVPSLKDLLISVNFDDLAIGEPTNFHGDFILDNILKTETGYLLLDWRQDFGGSLSIGDIYYDLAKLNHSFIVNHEVVAEGKFKVDIQGSEVSCEIYRKQSLVESQNALHKFIEQVGLNRMKVDILTSIIWLNMATLHHHPFDHFLFNFGKYSLFKALNNDR